MICFGQVNACKVFSSLFNLTDTCTITVGRKRKWKDENVTDLTEIIKRGDAIEVKLGYGRAVETVFKGHLTQVKTGTPVTIECENEAWKLKQMPIANKYYESLAMADFVSEYLGGYTVLNADVNFGEGLLPSPLAGNATGIPGEGRDVKKMTNQLFPGLAYKNYDFGNRH